MPVRAGLVVGAESSPSSPRLSRYFTWILLISVSSNARLVVGFMNREAGRRTEKSQYFVFRLLGRQGPAETQIRAHAPAQLHQSSVGGSWGSAQPVVTGALFPFPAGPSVSTTSDPHPRGSGDTGAGQSRLLWPTAP